jgi:hypothetical protein
MIARSSSPTPGSGRALSSISLGAAVALFVAVFFGYDPPASQAAGNFFEDLFGPSHPPAALGYNDYVPRARAVTAPRPRHVARQPQQSQRGHLAQARRQLTERKLFALNRRALPPESRRMALEPVTPIRTSLFRISTATNEPAPAVSRRAVCVRACDGYAFPALPVSRGSDISAQQASCERLCPGAQSTLFVYPAGSDRLEEARAARGGDTYAALLARLDPDRARSCSCQTEASAAAASDSLLRDSTLRPGDSVVTAQGVRVLRRGSHYPFRSSDFLSLTESRDTPVSNKSALYAIERALKTPQGRIAVASASERRRNVR